MPIKSTNLIISNNHLDKNKHTKPPQNKEKTKNKIQKSPQQKKKKQQQKNKKQKEKTKALIMPNEYRIKIHLFCFFIVFILHFNNYPSIFYCT